MAVWWSGIMTTTGNSIFVCYDDTQQQQASMPCHTEWQKKKCSKNDASAKIVNIQQKWGEHV